MNDDMLAYHTKSYIIMYDSMVSTLQRISCEHLQTSNKCVKMFMNIITVCISRMFIVLGDIEINSSVIATRVHNLVYKAEMMSVCLSV